MPRAPQDADEHDAFSPHRRLHPWQRGELRRIKRRANKRDRRAGRRIARAGAENGD